MLDLKLIRERLAWVQDRLSLRGQDLPWDTFESLDKDRREILQEAEALKHRRNTVSDQIGRLKKEKQEDQEAIEEMRQVSKRIKELDDSLAGIEEKFSTILLTLPNIPHETVPVGYTSEDNPVVRTWGEKPSFSFTPRPHWEIGEELDILDFERATRMTGARFVVYKGLGARLERALINFMLDLHTTKHGYTEILPPFLVNSQSLTGTGQFAKISGRIIQIGRMGLFPDPHRRGASNQSLSAGNPFRTGDAQVFCCLHPLLSLRGRFIRQGHQGVDPPAPV